MQKLAIIVEAHGDGPKVAINTVDGDGDPAAIDLKRTIAMLASASAAILNMVIRLDSQAAGAGTLAEGQLEAAYNDLVVQLLRRGEPKLAGSTVMQVGPHRLPGSRRGDDPLDRS